MGDETENKTGPEGAGAGDKDGNGADKPDEKGAEKQEERVDMAFSDVDPGNLEEDAGPTIEQKFEHVVAENRKMREVLGQWERYRAAIEAEQQQQRQTRDRRPAPRNRQAEDAAGEGDDDGAPSDRDPGRAYEDVIADLRSEMAEMRKSFEATLHKRDVDRSTREARQQVAQALGDITAKHGDIISDVEVYAEWRKNPEISAQRAAQIVLHRRLSGMKGRYAVATPKAKPAPFVPGASMPRMPDWTPPKPIASEEDFDEAFAGLVKHMDDNQ